MIGVNWIVGSDIDGQPNVPFMTIPEVQALVDQRQALSIVPNTARHRWEEVLQLAIEEKKDDELKRFRARIKRRAEAQFDQLALAHKTMPPHHIYHLLRLWDFAHQTHLPRKSSV
jgi:hypothetical protein